MKSLISVTPREFKRDFIEVMDKYGINASNPKLSKVEAIMTGAFEDEGVYSLISPEVKNRFAKAVEIAAKKLIEMM